jgi:hypothetical protein
VNERGASSPPQLLCLLSGSLVASSVLGELRGGRLSRNSTDRLNHPRCSPRCCCHCCNHSWRGSGGLFVEALGSGGLLWVAQARCAAGWRPP